jgi:hypothetical protein
MIRFEDIKAGALIQGVEPGEVVRVVTSEPIGDNALTVYYKKSDGALLERLLYRSDEMNLALAASGRHFSINAAFKLVVESLSCEPMPITKLD